MAEVSNELVDFAHCQLGDLGGGASASDFSRGPRSLTGAATANMQNASGSASSSRVPLPPSVSPLPPNTH